MRYSLLLLASSLATNAQLPPQLASLQGNRRYADNPTLLMKDPKDVAVNFPDVDIELHSPAFLHPDTVPAGFANGTASPMNQDVLEDFMKDLSERNSWMTYNPGNFTSDEGRSIPYMCLSSTQGFDGEHTNKLRIYIHGGVHGDEAAGEQSVLAFLGKLDANATWASQVLEKMDLLVLPRYSPDSSAYFQRYLATNIDPNLDHVRMVSRQVRDTRALKLAWDPHVALDLHEYSAIVPYNTSKIVRSSQDCQFAAFKNPNVHPIITELSEGLFTPHIAALLDERGFTHSTYLDIAVGESSRFPEFTTKNDGDDIVHLSQGINFLSETRGMLLADQQFARRTAAGLTFIEAMIQTAANNADKVYRGVEDARAAYANSNTEIIVTSYPNYTNISWSFIDTDNGSVIELPIGFGSNTPPIANLTRPRPEAYVFSGAWQHVADLLQATGVEVSVLEGGFEGQVEALNITSAEPEGVNVDGFVQMTVETSSTTRMLQLPPGAFWVSSRQRHVAHAFMRLEPEAESSFASWNILPSRPGYEYPVYRVLRDSS